MMAKLSGEVSRVNKKLNQILYQSQQGWGHQTKGLQNGGNV